jgi:2-methylcitrate dehydratase PrpD
MSQSEPSQQLFSKKLSEKIYKIRDAAISDEALEAATLCVLDFFASAIAGVQEPTTAETVSAIQKCGGDSQALVLANGERTSVPLAALANGILGHILDYDDTIWTYIGHSTAVIFPAALAVAEAADCTGEEMLAALSLGVETAHLIGSPITPLLGQHGWHASSAVGIFGAAAAASILLGSDSDHLSRTLGLATNMASGIKQNFGFSAKPFGLGWAAHAGVMAATFASEGFSGAGDAFEGQQGFYENFVKGVPPSMDRKTGAELAMVNPGVSFKLYPSCTGSHPSIEAIIHLCKENKIPINTVSYIKVQVTPEVPKELIYTIPATPAQGKFSLPFCAAIALVYGDVELKHFSENYINDADVKNLMEIVEVLPDETLERHGGPNCPASRVTIGLDSGDVFEKVVNVAKGNPGHTLTPADLREKFDKCAQWAGLASNISERFIEQILSIRSIPSIANWMEKEVAPIFRNLND